MTIKPLIRYAAAILALVLITPYVDAAERDHTLRSTFPSHPGKRLVVDGGSLNIRVRGADVKEIEAVTELRISGIKDERADTWIQRHIPSFEDSSDALEVAHRPGRDPFMWFGHLTARAQINFITPTSVTPDLTTVTGLISVRGDFAQAKPMFLRSSSGNIEFSGAVHALDLRTTSGDAYIEVIRPIETLFARNSSGDVTLTGGAREVHVDTAAGDVWLNNLSGSVEVVTSGGKVTLRWDRLEPHHTVKVKTAGGRIDLVIPNGCQPRGRLTTITGTIRSGFPGHVNESGETVILSGDGPLLEVETTTGAILLSQGEE